MNLQAISAPSYKHRRIGTLQALEYPLSVRVATLEHLARRADGMYRTAQEITKADGSVRRTYDAFKPLKAVHRRIKTQILDHVVFPPYLTGSIRGQDYKTNAALHSGAKIVFNEDISGFFPTTTAARVYDIWHGFFGFSDPVAQCLTRLTTYRGELPQGAITSPSLANLVFWRMEPRLQAKFAAQGLTYSRYVDDIAVSSVSMLDPRRKTEVIRWIYGMLLRHGYHAKRIKHDISTASNRMAVTKLAINVKPGLEPEERARIRAAVHEIEQLASSGSALTTASGPYASAMGRVNTLGRFHRGEAMRLRQRLLRVKERMCRDAPKNQETMK